MGQTGGADSQAESAKPTSDQCLNSGIFKCHVLQLALQGFKDPELLKAIHA